MIALLLMLALSLLLAFAGWLWTSPRAERDATRGGLLVMFAVGAAIGTVVAGWLGWFD